MPPKKRAKTVHLRSSNNRQHYFASPHHSPPLSPLTVDPLFPLRAPTPILARHLLPRRPKRSDAAACARYRLRKKGTVVDDLRHLLQHCRREAKAHNCLVVSSLVKMRMLLIKNEHILSSLLSLLPTQTPIPHSHTSSINHAILFSNDACHSDPDG
jgi:hypothetical protein